MKWILYFVITTLSTVILAVVTSTMWGWFIVPTFGAPVISGVQAYGLILVIGLLFLPIMMTLVLVNNETIKDDEFTKGTVRSIVIAFASGIVLLFGWVVSSLWM